MRTARPLYETVVDSCIRSRGNEESPSLAIMPVWLALGLGCSGGSVRG